MAAMDGTDTHDTIRAQTWWQRQLPPSPLARSLSVQSILYAVGVPASRETAGSPLLGLFSDAFTTKYPIRHVPTYGPPSNRSIERQGQPLDQEMIDRLRSLGYVR